MMMMTGTSLPRGQDYWDNSSIGSRITVESRHLTVITTQLRASGSISSRCHTWTTSVEMHVVICWVQQLLIASIAITATERVLHLQQIHFPDTWSWIIITVSFSFLSSSVRNLMHSEARTQNVRIPNSCSPHACLCSCQPYLECRRARQW